jgi:hypothetical protein
MTGCQGLFGGNSTSTSSGAVSLSNANLDFGTVVVGSSKSMTDTMTNSTSSAVTISSAAASDSHFRIVSPSFPMTLMAGQTMKMTVSFTPSAAGNPAGKLALRGSSLGNGEMDVALTGNGVDAGKLTVSPATVSFGSVRVGQSMATSATMTNSGDSSVTVTQASASNSAFNFTGLNLPVTLGPGQSTTFSLVFAPKSAGQVTGNVAMNGAASLALSSASGQSNTPSTPTTTAVSVSGNGVTGGQLALSPASVSFGNINVGSSQSQNVSLTNAGGSSATISAASVTGSGFTMTGPAVPFTLSTGQSASFTVTFKPGTAGAAAGSIVVTSNAADASLSAALTGTGVTPGTLSVTPPTLGFGSVPINTKQSQNGTISNTGGASITVSQATVTGTGYSLSGLNLPATLSPGQTAGFTVTFSPQAAGNSTGSVAFSGSAPTATLTLNGSGLASGSLAANPASVNFGSVLINTPQSQTITLTNSGAAAATVSSITPTGSGFGLSGVSVPLVLQSGQSASFTATFTPTSAGNATGSISLASNASNAALSIPLSGSGVTAGSLAANPSSVSFGSVQVGSTQTKSEVITNSGGSSITISNMSWTGTGFSTNGFTAPVTLNAGQSVTFSILFTPQSAGSLSGNLAFTAGNTNLNIALSGSGSSPGQLSVTPTTVSFGSVTVGQSSNQNATITANGGGVTISGAASNNGEFKLGGLSLPVTLNAGQSATFTLTFTPQASGTSSGSLSFTSNATNSPTAEAVSGTGVAPVQHTASLAWAASTSTVTGYNVYRGVQTGGPYAQIGSANGTNYADGTVQSGTTYFYVVTAVDSAGHESVFSNQVQAVVPTP